ncbi:MAG: regulatory protein RecX [Acidobacteriaceae bacterium]|nr:regulatory protein RecX [Acidobacteriaceae bacterium]MBV9498981.1 regulatory protein RecX [Acidobacteriaceae bacterium]
MAIRKTPQKLDENALWEYALRLVARRSHSISELKTKLSIRAHSTQAVNATIVKLGEYGLADDAKFAETFAGSRLQNQGFGRSRVLRDLGARRVSQSLASQAVEKTFAGTDETKLIERYLTRKYRGKDLAAFLQAEKNLAAAYRRLRNAGFSSGASLKVLKRFSQLPDNFEDPESSEEYSLE